MTHFGHFYPQFYLIISLLVPNDEKMGHPTFELYQNPLKKDGQSYIFYCLVNRKHFKIQKCWKRSKLRSPYWFSPLKFDLNYFTSPKSLNLTNLFAIMQWKWILSKFYLHYISIHNNWPCMIDNVPENVANLKDKTYKIKQSLVMSWILKKWIYAKSKSSFISKN